MTRCRGRNKKILVPIIVAFCLLLGSRDAEANTGSVCIVPDSLGVAVNQVFAVDVFVTADITELMGYNIAVVYDSSVIELQSVDEGTLPLGSSYLTFFEWLNPPPADSLHVNGAILGSTVDGPGTLFTLTFKAADLEVQKETDIVISFSVLRNGVNEDIVHTLKHGYVFVVPPIPVEPTTWGRVKSLYGR